MDKQCKKFKVKTKEVSWKIKLIKNKVKRRHECLSV